MASCSISPAAWPSSARAARATGATGCASASTRRWPGTGAFGFATAVKRYSSDRVLEAHSYVIQTFADFGAIGLMVSAVLLVSWVLAVRRTLRGAGPPGGSPSGDGARPA